MQLRELRGRNSLSKRIWARAEERKALDIAQNMANSGFPIETIVAMTKLDPEKVKAMKGNR